MWSAGVMLYFILTGTMPFNAGTNSELKEIVKLGKFSFPEEQILSSECKSLISSLLTVDPEKRKLAAEALDHPWFAKTLLPNPTTNINFKNLTKYLKLDRVQKLVIAYIATHTSETQLLKEMNAFLKINTSRSGVLSKEEVIEWMAEKGIEGQAEEAFDKLDISRSRGVEYFGKSQYKK